MFFVFPVAVDFKLGRFPLVTFVLLGLNVALYLLGWVFFFSAPDEADPLIWNLGFIPARSIWWTWITSQFVHAGFFHVVGNMMYLFLFGTCVEDLLGRWRFACFYVLGGLLANLSQALFTIEPASQIPVVGASGAISACLGAFLVALPGTKINFRYFVWAFFRGFSGDFWLSARIVIAFWFLSDVLSLLSQLGNHRPGGGIAFAAHVGGMMAGGLAMWGLRRGVATGQQAARRPVATSAPRPPLPRELSTTSATAYLLIDGKQVGPYPLPKIKDMVSMGALPAACCFWKEGMSEWRPVSEL